jgi:CheY-like chemotaxis protein
MVDEVAQVMQLIAGRKGLEFHLSVDPSVPDFVFAERDTIQDMLRRLLDNSIRFTTRGAVSLTATAARLKESESVLLSFEVRDTGPGIPAALLDEFHGPAGSIRTGLGLSIVQKRLADMHGELTAGSSPSEGAAVRIALPVQVAPSAPVAERRDCHIPARPDATAPLKLLVAEDSNDSFDLFELYVQPDGHRVSRAFNGMEALEMAKANEYDLIVMDIDMPVMDGYTATRMIREWETEQRRTRIPILMLSAESAARQRRVGASAGCSGYLTKPVPRDEVLRALQYFSADR